MMRHLYVFITVLFILLLSCEKKEEEKFGGIVFDKPAQEFCLRGWEEGKEKEVCLSHFRGKVVLMFFGYTHCPDVCPMALQVLADTMKLLPEEKRSKVQVIFVSVDPDRDTPEKSQKYAEYFYPTFIGVTGSHEELKKVAKAYMVFYKKVEGQSEGGYLVDHTAYIYLIDPEGTLKLIYNSQSQKPQIIAKDIERII